ncbi:MAG: alkaline phosphatase PhoX [Novosphingobium sp.]
MNLENEVTAYSDGDVDTNRSSNTSIHELIDQRYSRRQTLLCGASAGAVALFGTSMLSACGEGDTASSPTVSAGANATTGSGRVVTLAGTASTGSGTWTQTEGPTVTLTVNGNTATFLAPSVAADTALKFKYTATGSNGTSSSAETTVTVKPASLGFNAVPKSLADVVTVPAGYTVTVLYRTGDPIAAGVPAYANNGSDTNFDQRAGDHHDGMHYFGLAATGNTPDITSNTRGVMAINHENMAGTVAYMHTAGQTNGSTGPRPYDEAIKEIEAHGVSLVEFARAANGTWGYVQGSALNRRITPNTTVDISGPVKGAAFMKTAFSTDGTKGRGTINNCANGHTPWNTYLTCEENWVGYFRRNASDVADRAAISAKQNTSLTRYGRSANGSSNNAWPTATPLPADPTIITKWNITVDTTKPADGTGDFRHEIFQYGWVVEIDPYDTSKAPRKRTALGRMNHEGAWPGKFVAGTKPAWYMGDDAQNEYLYKFVSNTAWVANDANATDRLSIGDKYLDAGTLYVAKFNADGSGQWLALVFGQNGITAANPAYPFADQADVLANARLAADVAGATKMDRPEWTAVNPANGEVYLTLTNNSSRGGSGPAPDAANPRAYTDSKVTTGSTSGNANGHIIRLHESGDTTEATAFTWDIYLFAAGADLDATNINLSGLDATNDLSSPDGLWFGRTSNASGLVKPLMWIETDDGAYTDVTNCMLLCSQPGVVGDGTTKTVTNTVGGSTVTTRVGAAPGGNLRRFLVGPKECEITGIDTTPDGRTLFVNIQHPGENGTAAAPTSNWPASQAGASTARPRSATIAITKDDGGVVGL